MKTIIFTTVLALLFCAGLFAQDKDFETQPQTIFSGGAKVTGWFIDFNNSYSHINGKCTYLPGFSGGIVMNRNFRLGLTGKSLSYYETYLYYPDRFDEPVYLVGGYGGLYMEASPIDSKVIHVSFPLILGGGGATYMSKNKFPEWEADDDEWEWDYDRASLSTSPFFVIEPGVNLEVNITAFMKLYAGYSYRWTGGLRLEHTSHTAFNGSNFNMGLRFGKF